MAQYESGTTYPAAPGMERKVKWASIASYLGSVAALAVLNGVTEANLVSGLPDGLEVILAPLVPALAAGIAGYMARHTPRPDLPPHQR